MVSFITRNNIRGYRQLSDDDKALYNYIHHTKIGTKQSSTAVAQRVIEVLNKKPSLELVKVLNMNCSDNTTGNKLNKYLMRYTPAEELTRKILKQNYESLGSSAHEVLDGLLLNPSFLDPEQEVPLFEAFFRASSILPNSKIYIIQKLIAKRKMTTSLAIKILTYERNTLQSWAWWDVKILYDWLRKNNPEWDGLPDDWLASILIEQLDNSKLAEYQ